MVAGTKRLEHTRGGSTTRGEGDRPFAPFQGSQAFFQHSAVRIAIADVEEAAIGFLLEGGGEGERRGDRSSGGVSLSSGMDGERFNMHGNF